MPQRKKYPSLSSDAIKDESTPEKGLLTAILHNAIIDAVGTPVTAPNTATVTKQARQWLIYSEADDTETPFSYGWVCNQLDICPLKIRLFITESIRTNTKYVRDNNKLYAMHYTRSGQSLRK